MNYWLVKQEPSSYSWDDFKKDKSTDWTGVRNYQARNFLQEMVKGDKVLFYHSGDKKEVVGIAEVKKAHFPDPTSDDDRWIAVNLKADKALKAPVSLAQIKGDNMLQDIHLVKNSRLSVMPLSREAFDQIINLSEHNSKK